MIDAISKLVESGAISEDVQKSIQEAWDNKIKENRETVLATGSQVQDPIGGKASTAATRHTQLEPDSSVSN